MSGRPVANASLSHSLLIQPWKARTLRLAGETILPHAQAADLTSPPPPLLHLTATTSFHNDAVTSLHRRTQGNPLTGTTSEPDPARTPHLLPIGLTAGPATHPGHGGWRRPSHHGGVPASYALLVILSRSPTKEEAGGRRGRGAGACHVSAVTLASPGGAAPGVLPWTNQHSPVSRVTSTIRPSGAVGSVVISSLAAQGIYSTSRL